MEALRQTVPIPLVRTEVVASYKVVEDSDWASRVSPQIRGAFRPTKRVPTWKVSMYFPGPDSRYNGAFAELVPDGGTPGAAKTVSEFLSDLEAARKSMEVLHGQQFDGTYRKQIGRIGAYGRYVDPQVEVLALLGHVRVKIKATSSTHYTWDCTLNLAEVEEAIQAVRSIPEQAGRMLATLAALQ